MARIAGVDLPNNKRILFALTSIYGIGRTTAAKICAEAKIEPTAKASDLTDGDINKLREIIEKTYKVEGELRAEISINIKRLQDINCYRGQRHRKNLPVRGQRSKTNARTVKGSRRGGSKTKKSSSAAPKGPKAAAAPKQA